MFITISRTFNRSLCIKPRIPKNKAESKDEIEPKKPLLNLSNQVQLMILVTYYIAS